MRNIHLPVWLGVADLPHAGAFAVLHAIEGFTRAILVTVLPLQAYRLLGDAQKVSALYFAVGVAGLLGSFVVPFLVHHMPRRWVYGLGAICVFVAGCLLALRTLPALAAGMAAHAFAVACIEVSFSLYLMDHIGRRDFSRFEPLRLFLAACSWTLGPWLGIYLEVHVAPWAPFAVVGLLALAMLGYFRFLGLTEAPAASTRAAINPLVFLPRFVRQPRLRLAWLLAVGRSAWWGLFYVYAPIYAVASGLGDQAGGVIVSLGFAALFLAPLWGWFGRRYGLKRLLIAGYGLGGVATLAVAAVADLPWLGVAVLIGAAWGMGMVDGAGNVPFLRAVRPLERPQMTTVYATYRHAAHLGPPGVFALLLKAFALPAVFAVGGAAMLGLAYLSRHVPRRF
ncbi:MAG: MFS transporter [Pseudomonadota bacterium]